jgi:hypothetical protein
MRRFFGVAVLTWGMLMGFRAAGAQLVDPSTGSMVDAATDPMDFSAIASGQPGNFGMEAAISASTQAQAFANQAMANAQVATDSAIGAANANDGTPVMRAPSVLTTPKPVITPLGGTFVGSVQVTLVDSDRAAAVFYTTDGKKPTTSSLRYVGPIFVSAKTRVQAMAFDVNMRPSGVVSKTFKKGS